MIKKTETVKCMCQLEFQLVCGPSVQGKFGLLSHVFEQEIHKVATFLLKKR